MDTSSNAFIVEETQSRSVQIRHGNITTTITFRPRQVLVIGDDDRMIELADKHGIAVRPCRAPRHRRKLATNTWLRRRVGEG